jgi:hypothetical protein
VHWDWTFTPSWADDPLFALHVPPWPAVWAVAVLVLPVLWRSAAPAVLLVAVFGSLVAPLALANLLLGFLLGSLDFTVTGHFGVAPTLTYPHRLTWR